MILKRRISGIKFLCIWVVSCQGTSELTKMSGDVVVLNETETLTCKILWKTTQADESHENSGGWWCRLDTGCTLTLLHLAFLNPISTAGPVFKQKTSLGQILSYGVT